MLGECTWSVDALLRLVADIAYLKEAIRTRIGVKSPEAVFVAACNEGRKPETQQAKSSVIAWFEWARRERIVIAMSGGDVYMPKGEVISIEEMIQRYSRERVKFLPLTIMIITIKLFAGQR